jgi:hypothetical protein
MIVLIFQKRSIDLNIIIMHDSNRFDELRKSMIILYNKRIKLIDVLHRISVF